MGSLSKKAGWLNSRNRLLPEEAAVEEMLSFVKEAEQENTDPIVTEAEKIFGKEFIEVYDD